MSIIFGVLSITHSFVCKVWSRVLMYVYKTQFCSVGNKVVFDPVKSSLSYKTINIGSNVFIGAGAIFSADRSTINIGSYVMFGPNVTISGGDHDISSLVKPMYLIVDKPDSCDADVVVQDDVWVGANSVILKGVTLGTGSIVAAGSIVTKNVDPYSIYAGAPAKKIKARFSSDELEIYINNMESFGIKAPVAEGR